MTKPPPSCATEKPWREHPFRLISWLDMEKFSAEVFVDSAALLGKAAAALDAMQGGIPFSGMEFSTLIGCFNELKEQCEKIELTHSASACGRLVNRLEGAQHIEMAELRTRCEELHNLVSGELEAELFLWVPSHRAGWYSKDAEELLGEKCCKRFRKIVPEVEEAMKCHAVGRYTAAAFHLMRATEAAVKALGRAIGMTPSHPGWKLVLDEVWRQYKTPASRHPAWATHEPFLVKASADLRAISKVWRNDIAHFVDTYTEERAKPMFEIVAAFLRDLATQMNENGRLY